MQMPLPRCLQWAGFAAPLVYLATVVVGGWTTPGYSHRHQPVSALFETGAPHAGAISAAFMGYNLLLMLFGHGLWRSTRPARLPGLAAWMIVLNGLLGLLIELAPMDPMGSPVTLPGAVHMVIAGLLVLTCALAMLLAGLGWKGQGAIFPTTMALLAIMLVTGALAAMAAAQAWPWLGLLQRLTIGSYLLWLVVAAAHLQRDTISAW